MQISQRERSEKFDILSESNYSIKKKLQRFKEVEVVLDC